MNLINLTPHDINIYNDKKELERTIHSEGSLRLKEEFKIEDSINNIKIVDKTYYIKEEDLPPRKNETLYIVSLPFLMGYNGDRDDFIAPDTGATCVRGDNGQILGVTQFLRLK